MSIRKPRLVGYAALFDSYSEPMQGFREVIQKGAFSDSIKADDVKILWNHNADFPLGRTANKTLTLKEDDRGLWFEATPPDTQWARDLMKSIKRKDVSSNSFGFEIQKDSWETRKKETVRVLQKVRLYEISPVVFPAYSETMVEVKDFDD